jgi:hypothetical protein
MLKPLSNTVLRTLTFVRHSFCYEELGDFENDAERLPMDKSNLSD